MEQELRALVLWIYATPQDAKKRGIIQDVIEVINNDEDDTFQVRLNGQEVAYGNYANEYLHLSGKETAHTASILIMGVSYRILKAIEFDEGETQENK